MSIFCEFLHLYRWYSRYILNPLCKAAIICTYRVLAYSSRKYIHVHRPRLHHHYHHVVPLARISVTLFRNFSLSFIASGRSSGIHPVSLHSCCMYVRAGRPAFTRPWTPHMIPTYKSNIFIDVQVLFPINSILSSQMKKEKKIYTWLESIKKSY